LLLGDQGCISIGSKDAPADIERPCHLREFSFIGHERRAAAAHMKESEATLLRLSYGGIVDEIIGTQGQRILNAMTKKSKIYLIIREVTVCST
jgi:hypothetical protein